MLSPWYFCCCISSNPDKTSTYLAILETLQNVETDLELARIACQELVWMESWSQIYALPTVLHTLRRFAPEQRQPVAAAYFESMLAALPEEARSANENLLSLSISQSEDRDDLLSPLTAAARGQTAQGRTLVSTPYLDLREFQPEVILLAVLAEQLAHVPSFVGRLLAVLEGQQGAALDQLIERGLEGRFGRYPLLLAHRVALFMPQRYRRMELRQRLIAQHQATLLTEPDLLELLVGVVYFYPEPEMDPNTVRAHVTRMCRETWTLEELRKLFQAVGSSSSSATETLTRVGAPTADRNLQQTLPIVYWQVALWQEAGRLAARHRASHVFAAQLPGLWRARDQQPDPAAARSIRAVSPQPVQPQRYWRGQLEALAAMAGAPAQVPVQSGPAFELDPLLFTSPWLHFDRRHFDWQGDQKQAPPRYPSASSYAVLLRLCLCNALAIDTLLRLPPQNSHRPLLAALVAHTSDVLEDQSIRGAPRELLGLVQSTQDLIGYAGRATFQAIPPEHFLQTLRTDLLPELVRRQVLPGVLARWIMGAYNGAVGQEGPTRWLPLLAQFYHDQNHFNDRRFGFRQRLEMALLVRFLLPDHARPDPRGLRIDWRGQPKGLAGVSHRQLMLTDNLPPEVWSQPEWDQLDWSDPRRSQLQLSLAIERMASLSPADTSVDKATRERWRREWIVAITGIDQRQDLDRFIRLRLIELLDKPALAQEVEGQGLTALLLFEQGSHYDLNCMFDRIFATGPEGRLVPVDLARGQVQERLLRAMYREVTREAGAGQHKLMAQNPRAIRSERLRLRLIKERLTAVVFRSVATKAATGQGGGLASSLAALQERLLNDQAEDPQQVISAEVEQRDTGQRLVLEQSQPIDPLLLKAAIYDPNDLTATLIVENLDLSGVTNLFPMRLPQLHTWLAENANRSMPVLGLVVGKTANGTAYVFNVGPCYRTWNAGERRLPELQDDTLVRLETISQGNLDSWNITSVSPTLPRRRSVSQIVRRRVEELRDQYNHYQLNLPPGASDEAVWAADVSRWHRRNTARNSWDVFAQIESDGRLVPVDHDLLGLITRIFRNTVSQAVTLTLIAALDNPDAPQGWRFSSRPGENYFIARDEVAPAAAQALDAELGRRPEARGLLVTLTLCPTEQGVRLALAEQAPPRPAYDGLQVPFDTRNLEWAALFEDAEGVVARFHNTDKPHWRIYLDRPLPGFRPWLYCWISPSPQGRYTQDDEIDVTITRWNEENQRKAAVHASPVRHTKARPRDNNEIDFLERWLSPRCGQRLTLRSVLTRFKLFDGTVICLTDENIAVSVEVDSLTMKPVSPESELGLSNPRQATIIHTRWEPHRTAPQIRAQPPDEAVDPRQQCEGLILEVPDRFAGQARQCTVLWHTRQGAARQILEISNIGELRARPGWRLRGSRGPDGWEFELAIPRVQTRALWSVSACGPSTSGLTYLGRVETRDDDEQEQWAAAQKEPGLLVRLPDTFVQSHAAPRHLSKSDGQTFSQGLRPDQRTRNSAGLKVRWYHNSLGSFVQRCVLQIEQEHLKGYLTGTCQAYPPDGPVQASMVEILIEPDGDLYDVRRHFRLSGAAGALLQREEPQAALEQREQQLRDYLDSPHDLECTYDPRGLVRLRNLLVPDDQHSAWAPVVPLAPGEGPFIRDDTYASEGLARLFRDQQGRVRASLRQVPAIGPRAYMQKLGGTYARPVKPLGKRLNYVGREQTNPLTGVAHPEPCHRFEWGYGLSLLVPERQLLYSDQPFTQRTQIFLYHGDAVKLLEFQPFAEAEPAAESEAGETDLAAQGCMINILAIDPSQARTLYEQRHEYRMVHVLHLLVSSTEARISYIEGVDVMRVSDLVYRFDRVHASLDAASQAQIVARLAARQRPADSEALEHTIYGRLNEHRFNDTLGREVLFDHVRLSFEPGPHGLPLEVGEATFLMVQNIVEMRNDMGLQLFQHPEIDRADVGPDFLDPATGRSQLLMLRRFFSVRQDTLRQIFKERGGAALSGSLLVARFNRVGSRISPDLLRDEKIYVPPRNVEALSTAIDLSREAMLASVVTTTERTLCLELNPGVFVRLRREHLEQPPGELPRSTIVRVIRGQSSRKFQVIRAAPGDARYITAEPRYAVALPMNTLLNPSEPQQAGADVRSDSYWLPKGFTIGGLPDIIAHPGSYDHVRRTWGRPLPMEFTALMRQPHPKIVQVAQDQSHEWRLEPARPSQQVGRLIIQGAFDVLHEPLGAHGSAQPARAEWRQLTFADEPAQTLAQRASGAQWAYHDTETGTWVETDRVEHMRLGRHSALTGPLFFEPGPGGPRLRYSPQQMLRHAFPFTALAAALSQPAARHGLTVTVAGSSDLGGLWVELAPGQIAELPGQMLTYQVAEDHPENLANFDWQLFAPGDQIDLGLSGGALKVRNFVLKRWRPGPRAAFGPQCCLLPVQGYDEQTGALTLGAGDYRLTLPLASLSPGLRALVLPRDGQPSGPSESRALVLLSDNQLAAPADQPPEPGDTVLIGVQVEGQAQSKTFRPFIYGRPSLQPFPHAARGSWQDDPFAELIIDERGNLRFRVEQLELLVSAAGGALPMTIEAVEGSRLYVSRRHQRLSAQIRPGTLVLAYVAGLIAPQRLVLRWGGGLRPVALEDLVPGVPPSCRAAVVELLRREQCPIWLQITAEGQQVFGFGQEQTEEPLMRALGVVTADDSDKPETQAGLICQSTHTLKLYWMSAGQAAWMRLAPSHLRTIYFEDPAIANPRVFRARIQTHEQHQSGLSRIGRREFQIELAALKIGRELSVRVLQHLGRTQDDDFDRLLVISQTTGLALECIVYDYTAETYQPGRLILAEVVRRIFTTPPQLVVVPLGKKRYRLDLPRWMQAPLPAPQNTYRPEVERYLANRRNQEQPWREGSLNLNTADDEMLELRLCQAYNLLAPPLAERRSPVDYRFQAEAAMLWYRRSQQRSEIFAAYGLIALLLLDNISQMSNLDIQQVNNISANEAGFLLRNYQHYTRELLQQLGKRALRSMHSEVIANSWLLNQRIRQWLNSAASIDPAAGLWRRLKAAQSNLQAPQNINQFRGLRQLYYSVDLRQEQTYYNDIFPIADAILASTGAYPPLARHLREETAHVTLTLARLGRGFPPGSELFIHPLYREKLRRLLHRITAQALDVVLLEPLLPLRAKDASS